MSKITISAKNPEKYANLQTLCKKILDDLYLQDWNIDIIVHEELTDNKGGAAHILPSHIYKFADLDIYQQIFNKEKVQHGIVYEAIRHEFMHCVLDKISKAARNRYISENEVMEAVESTTQHITRILSWKFNSKNYGEDINYNPGNQTEKPPKVKKIDKAKRGGTKGRVRGPNTRGQDKNRSAKDGKEASGLKQRRDGDVHR